MALDAPTLPFITILTLTPMKLFQNHTAINKYTQDITADASKCLTRLCPRSNQSKSIKSMQTHPISAYWPLLDQINCRFLSKHTHTLISCRSYLLPSLLLFLPWFLLPRHCRRRPPHAKLLTSCWWDCALSLQGTTICGFWKTQKKWREKKIGQIRLWMILKIAKTRMVTDLIKDKQFKYWCHNCLGEVPNKNRTDQRVVPKQAGRGT